MTGPSTARTLSCCGSRLLGAQRHGQPLEEICDLLYENESGLLPDEAARAMATLYRRNGRTNAEIANLENYVAQVREAYQNPSGSSDESLHDGADRAGRDLPAAFADCGLVWYELPHARILLALGLWLVIALSLVCLGGSIWYFKQQGLDLAGRGEKDERRIPIAFLPVVSLDHFPYTRRIGKCQNLDALRPRAAHSSGQSLFPSLFYHNMPVCSDPNFRLKPASIDR